MKQLRRMRTRSATMLLPLVAFFGSFFFTRAAEGQCQDATATRPILFVPGIWENATDWGSPVAGLRSEVIAQLSSTPGYSNSTFYDLYFDGTDVRLAETQHG